MFLRTPLRCKIEGVLRRSSAEKNLGGFHDNAVVATLCVARGGNHSGDVPYALDGAPLGYLRSGSSLEVSGGSREYRGSRSDQRGKRVAAEGVLPECRRRAGVEAKGDCPATVRAIPWARSSWPRSGPPGRHSLVRCQDWQLLPLPRQEQAPLGLHSPQRS